MRELREKSERQNKSLARQRSGEKGRLASDYSTIIDGLEQQRLVTNNTNSNSSNNNKKQHPLAY